MNKMRGFTLVELMIVVSIVAIIARVAYPSYQASVRKTNRSDAINALLDVSQKLERCYTTYGAYNNSTNNCSTTIVPSGTTSQKLYYNITIALDGTHPESMYTLTATANSSYPQTNDTTCRSFSITQAGVRTSKDSSGTDSTSARCW